MYLVFVFQRRVETGHSLQFWQPVSLVCFIFSIHLNLPGKETDMWYDRCVLGKLFCFVFPEIWLFFFFFPPLEGPECLSKVSTLAFWETYPCGMSVTFQSPQMSLGNFHIMAFVDRLLGLTVNMFETLSGWWKKNQRENLLPFETSCSTSRVFSKAGSSLSARDTLTATAQEGRDP